MKTIILSVITIVLLPPLVLAQRSSQPPAQPIEEEPEVLTSGPVHEAFAIPVDLEVQPGLIAPSEPPEEIEENLPAERPAGEYVWIPGYWAWDSQRTGYIWVSGCWRIAPPSRYWVPGYWLRVPDGWQWVPGFWASTSKIGQIEYLPEPPKLIGVEPPIVAASANSIWVPPCWYWYRGQYILRQGYWIKAQPNWIWVPSHYVWTPRGYVFVSGHWDHDFSDRGVLFAPVYFPGRILARPRISYSLSIVMDIGNLQFGLFTYPRYSHYYFGDYYDDVYLGIGIYPWFASRTRFTWYDPIYENYRWRFIRSNPRWDDMQRDDYQRRRENIDLRPSRTYREMENRLSKMPIIQQRNYWTAAPLKTEIAEKRGQMSFETVNNNEQQRISRKTTEVRNFGRERSQWESQSSRTQPIQQSMPPLGNRGTTTPSAGQRQPSMPSSGERQSRGNVPQVTQPSTPTVENRGTTTPSMGQRQPSVTSPGERQSRGNAPQVTQPRTSERVKTTTPPISNKPSFVDKMFGIFKESTPSRPTNEKKIDTSRENRQINSNRGNSSQSTGGNNNQTSTTQPQSTQGGANRRGR
jgi:hypothetical protein